MYAKVTQRGGAASWARHLSNTKDNDHVRIADLRGVAALDLRGAFTEIQATASRQCKKPFFCLMIAPAGGFVEPTIREHPDGGFITGLTPETTIDEQYTMADVFEACERMEATYPELADNARVIVEHEKEGRIHWHITWSRIKADGKAVNFKYPPNYAAARISYEMNNARGTPNPQGLIDIIEGKQKHTKTNPTLEQSRQAAKIGLDGVQIKQAIKAALDYSDKSPTSFKQQLLEAGFIVAQGDKRGLVAVHVSGEVFSLPRMLDMKAKDVREILGDPADYPTVTETKEQIKTTLKDAEQNSSIRFLKRRNSKLDKATEPLLNKLEARKQAIVEGQRKERYNHRHLPEGEQEALRLAQRQQLMISGYVAAFKKMIKRSTIQHLGQILALASKVSLTWFIPTLKHTFKTYAAAALRKTNAAISTHENIRPTQTTGVHGMKIYVRPVRRRRRAKAKEKAPEAIKTPVDGYNAFADEIMPLNPQTASQEPKKQEKARKAKNLGYKAYADDIVPIKPKPKKQPAKPRSEKTLKPSQTPTLTL